MSNNLNYTHNFFPYPAKFPPAPIKEHILKYTDKFDTVLDPFCGSGTVLVESLLNKRNAIGIDLNPVSALISQAKSKVYESNDLEYLSYIINELDEIKEVRDLWVFGSVKESDLPNYKNRELWFKENMLYEMAAIRKTYLHNENYKGKIKHLLWMAFLKIVVEVSNQENDTRYASIQKENLVDGFALQKFRNTLNDYLKVLRNYSFDGEYNNLSVNVLEGDVNLQIQNLQDSSVDLAITSPPYINTFDYYLYHKHRIFWMGKDPGEIRRQEIGCHHRIDTMSYEKAFNEYRDSMEELTKNISVKLKKGKYFIMLIGDGIVKGEVVKADDLMQEICERNNLSVEEIITTSFREVSRGFIKGRNLDKKKHHTIIMKR